MITRKEYMENSSVSHQQYYEQFVTDQTKIWVINNIGLGKLKNSKDGNFNDLGYRHTYSHALKTSTWIWDNAPVNVDKMRECGDCVTYPSLGSRTCVAKQAARILLHSYIEEN
jgi:hypothetical protein